MASQHVDIGEADWTSGAPFYGPSAVFNGNDIVQLKILSDRRAEGGGIAWLAKLSPPPGRLIKIVAKAVSDEHVQPSRWSGDQVRRTCAGLRRLYPESKRTAAQCHNWQLDRQPRHLSGRTGRDRFAGGDRGS